MRSVLAVLFLVLSACCAHNPPVLPQAKPHIILHWKPEAPASVCKDPPLEWPVGWAWGYTVCTLVAD